MKYTRTFNCAKSLLYNHSTVSIIIPEISYMRLRDNSIDFYIKNSAKITGSFIFFNGNQECITITYDSTEEAKNSHTEILNTLDEYYSQNNR